MKKQIALALTLLVLASLVLSACAQATQAPEEAAPEEAAPEEAAPEEAAPEEAGCPLDGTLKVGMIQPVTGPAATVAARTTAGAKMAVEEINAAGGIFGCEVELIIEDSQADAAVAVAAAEKLLNKDLVEVMIGAYHSHATLAVMPLLPEAEVPMLTIIATSPVVTDENNGWIYRISSTNPVDAQTAINDAWDGMGFDKTAFFPVNNDWGKSVPIGYEPVVIANGGEIVLNEPLEQGGTNFLPQLTKLRGTDADTVFVTIDIETTSTLAKQAYEAGMLDQYNWIGTSGQNPEEFSQLLADTPEIQEGWCFVAYYRPTYLEGGDFPANVEFSEKFDAAHPELGVNYAAAQGYQAAYIVKEALERAGVYEGPAISEALAETDFDGLTGHLEFDEKGQAYPGVFLHCIEDGEFVTKP